MGFREVSPRQSDFTEIMEIASPFPESGGSGSLWNYINLQEENRILLLHGFSRPAGVIRIILYLNLRRTGFRKSLSQHFLRELTDPNIVNLRSMPYKTDDLLSRQSIVTFYLKTFLISGSCRTVCDGDRRIFKENPFH